MTVPCDTQNMEMHSRLIGAESQEAFQPPQNGRALSHLDLASKTETVADGPMSGFMLLSVKRTSKFRPTHRTRSVSSLTSTVRLKSNELTDSNTIDSSGESSPNSSQSALDDEFDASGSIEAEEFEEDDGDDYDGTNEEDGAVVVSQHSSLGNSSFVPLNKASQYSAHIHQLIPDSTTDHCNGYLSSDIKASVNSASFSHPSKAAYQSASAVSYRKRRLLQTGRRARCDRAFQSTSYQTPYNVCTYPPAHLQTNMSHFIPRLNSVNPTSDSLMHQPSVPEQPIPPISSFPLPVTGTGLSTTAPPFNSTPHVNSTSVHYSHYTRPPLSCPHHLHPVTGTSEHHGAQNNQLLDEVSVNVSSIPPLQPASRFRKARIHETVEQWCHTRASVHDCRLKTVPDRVTELHKKSCMLENDVSTATGEKLYCFSCYDADSDHFANSDTANLTAPVHKAGVASVCTSSQDQLPVNYCGSLMEVSYNHGWPLTDLLSIWTNGTRTECFLSNIFNANPHLDVCTSFLNSANQSAADCCSLCAEPLQDAMSSAACQKHAPTADISLSSLDHPNEMRQAELDHTLSTDVLSTKTHSYSAVDPATTYFHRHQQDTDLKQHLTVCPGLVVQRGDNPMNNIHKLSPDIASFSSSSCSHSQDGSHPTLPHADSLDGTLRLLPTDGQPFNPTTVPPTSPMSNCTNLEDDHNSCGFASEPHNPDTSMIQPLVNGVYDQFSLAAPALHASNANQGSYLRQRVGSGSYHNVSQHEPSSFSDDFYSYNSATSLPPSPPDVAVRFPFESHIQTASGSIGGTGQSGSGATPSTPRPSTADSHKERSLGEQFVKPGSQAFVSPSKKRLLADSIENRVESSLGILRASVENAFRDELTTIHSENISLLTEVDRLKREVASLRKFRDAFFALRRVVPTDLWEQCIIHQHFPQQQQNPTHTNVPDSTLSLRDRPRSRSTSPVFNETS